MVDHWGDAAVAWRVARQLHQEHGIQVCLFVDHLPTLAALVPACVVSAPIQLLEGIQVVRWDQSLRADPKARILLETFGCGVPATVLQDLARQSPAPVWINLEYLSAESWVEHCHGLPSPHIQGTLTRHFFFPGFGAQTGGLLRERSLLTRRDQFQNDPGAQADFWQRLQCPAPSPETTVISLFGYDGQPLGDLLQAWRDSPTPIRCLIPASGTLAQEALSILQTAPTDPPPPAHNPHAALHAAQARGLQRWGALEWVVVAFQSQQDYDLLLWACHLNLVRGEDSFVRAQWAARPLLWQIYPQAEDAHWVKLEAFLARYLAGLPAPVAQAWQALFAAWNGRGAIAPAWQALWPHRACLQNHARTWANTLSRAPDLSSQLVHFAKSLL